MLTIEVQLLLFQVPPCMLGELEDMPQHLRWLPGPLLLAPLELAHRVVLQ